MKFNTRTLNWLIIGYCSIVLFISVVSINGSTALAKNKVLGFRYDYLFHIILFIPWMVLSCCRFREKKNNKFFWVAVGAGLLLAAVSEGVQLIVPARAFNPNDMLANGMGVLAGALIVAGGWRAKKLVNRQ
jgi:glycopeptide antibiotics resistance protein